MLISIHLGWIRVRCLRKVIEGLAWWILHREVEAGNKGIFKTFDAEHRREIGKVLSNSNQISGVTRLTQLEYFAMKLVLFDIDGTLITTHGAGMRAFYRAMDHLYHVEIDEDAIHPDGKTDPLILRELLDHLGFEDRRRERDRDAIFASYLGYLDEEMGRAREHWPDSHFSLE